MAEPLFPQGEPGRPSKLTDEEKQELLKEYEQYIRNTEDPTIVGFITTNEYCFEHRVLDHDIEQWQEFTDLKKIAQKKQEHYLLKNGGEGKYNPTMAIFRLKQPQHGYKDRVDTDITSGGNAIAPVLVRFMGDDSDTDKTD